ncbi:MAG: hypothetical protein JXJ04_10250, partial [Spirochaetales bacterium]|nr:hypothetical protein [Spirochaetales bacterium]
NNQLESDNMADRPVLVFINKKYYSNNDEKKKIVAILKEKLSALNVFGFNINGESFLVQSPGYIIDKISKFLRDLNEA